MEPSVITVPVDQEIKFKKVDLEVLKDSRKGYLKSPDFIVCNMSNVKYYVTIYPNGNNVQKRGIAGIFLHYLNGSAKTVDADIMFCFESANEKINLTKGSGKGIYLEKTSKFFDSKYFMNGELIVRVQGTFKITLPTGIKYPFSAEWKIKEADLGALKDSYGCLRSKRFSISFVSDIKYYLNIHPNGKKEENRGKTWVFLQLQLGTESKIKANFNVTIVDTDFSFDMSQVYEKNEGWGTSLCSTEDLFNPDKRCFADGEMIIKINGTLVIEKENVGPTVLSCEKGFASKAYQRHRGKGFTIFVEGKPIKVHKQVLINSSPVFAAMFESGMKEVQEKKMKIIDFDYEIVNAAVKLLYSDSVPTKFSFEQMLLLLQFSDKYDITLIKDLLQDYFIKNLSPTNVCSLLNFTSTIVNATKLLGKCKEYILKCSKESKFIPDLHTLDQNLLLQLFTGTFTQTLEIDNL